MKKTSNSMALLHLFLIFLLPPPLLVSSSHGRRDLITCLISGGVTNFTTPNSPHYNHLLTISIQNLRYLHAKLPSSKLFNPVAVVSPENETQVAVVVRCSQRRPFAIRLRGGGHSFESLSSRADHHPFVLVDLANLNRVSLDADAGTAWVGGGATLGELYYSLAVSTSRRGFPAGMCPTVGVGGHFSGGGYGALARKYGLSSDNVVDVRMVDGRGRVLDRRAMGEDVFWAVRGGGGGTWGAIVGWKVGLVEVPERVTVFRVVKSGRSAMVAKLWEKWQVVASSEVDDDLFVQGLVFGGGGGTTGAVSLMFMGMNLQPKLPTLAAMAVFFPELNVTQQDCKEVTWAEAVIFLRGDFEAVKTIQDLRSRHSFKRTFTMAKSDYVTNPIPTRALEGALDMISGQPKMSIILDPFGGALGRIEEDATPFPHRAGILYGIEYYVDWNEEDEIRGKGEEYMEGMRKVYGYMEPFVSNNPRRAYVNNVDLDLGVVDWSGLIASKVEEGGVGVGRDWGEKYFVGNYDRLVRAKREIDPDNVFRHPQSIPPF